MSVIESITSQAGRLVEDVQGSLKRARIEGERRLLQRQHRTALEALGERAYELVRAERLDGTELSPELAAVESKLMEIEAKVTELDEIRTSGDDDTGVGQDAETSPADPAATAFPMVDAPSRPDTGKTGWEGADRFFASDPDPTDAPK